tara:strand:- start:23133 stop:24230 length:1098 start_codon:yes stop_codon:yes gene_type:complete
MNLIRLDKLGENVSQLALGVNKTGTKENNNHDTEKNRILFYHEAMSLGVNLFDTAELYGGGYSEEILGKALRDRRHDAIICSKFNARNSDRNNLQLSLENSLKRLNTDYIDFYLSHWPNPTIPLQELVDSLATFQEQGKIRAFGIGNAVFSEIKDLHAKNKGNFFVVENEFNLLERQSLEDTIPFCQKNNHLFMAYSPFLQGKTVKFNDSLNYLIEKHNCTRHQLMLSWVFQKNVVSIVRTLNIDHLRDNISSMEINLSSDDLCVLEDSLGPKKVLIDIDQVKIDDRAYLTCEEAIDNKIDLIPSPALLSKRVGNNFSLPPLRTFFRNGKYEIIDDYYFSEIKKYWAWKICNKKEIEAYVFNEVS